MKTKIILLVFSLITVFSCTTDDELQRDAISPLIGVWQLESKSENNSNITLNVCDKQTTLSFEIVSFAYQPVFQNQSETCEDIPQWNNCSYTYQDQTITFTHIDPIDGTQIDIGQVISLSSSTMVLKIDFDDIYNSYNQILQFKRIQ